ncbi:uncharacterized protein LOC127723773 [Mytilus californianus]|uniref:uncharacterized protein LOC127723773 n=1 Tax=Mytilus californianus TaxID=6549 RepID=UPI0022481647|nr:uncharacterized protein LOC127723773 [Mytilus californianus]
MSHRYIKKRKSQVTYIVHKDGKSRKVTKSFKRESPGISTDTDQRGETTANDDVIFDGVQIQVPEENVRSLAALEEAPSCDQKKYEKAKYKRLENWAEVSKKLYQKGLQKQYLTGSTCNQCNIDTTDLYRCIDCINYHATCLPCLEKRHEFPHLHIFEKWMHGTFIGFSCPTPVWEDGSHQECSTSYQKDIVVVDDKGRQHMRTIEFCACEEEAVTLLQYDLWPSSPKHPRLAFHIDLLRWLNGLLLECQVSAKGFCEALKARQPKLCKFLVTKEGKEIYKLLINETIHQFRQFLYCMDYPTDADLDNGCSCPACFQCETKIFCFDADFQLVRKTSSGQQWLSPKHQERFFLDQKEVDSFMCTYNNSPVDNDCSDFQAGSNIRSKAKNKKLSETAVFGATCRHDYPQKFFSLKHGERLGYAVYLIKLLLNENNEQKMHVSYDIACLLKKHLQKNGHEDILKKVSFSIPIFHCYGHGVPCQILYGPRRTKNLGLTDGEGIERLWSYLGKFSSITKEMSPENRTDLLTDGLIYYGQKIKDKLGDTLVSKYKRASKLEENSNTSLLEMLSSFPDGEADMDIIEEWVNEEKTAILSRMQNSSNESEYILSKTDIYALDLQKYYRIRYDGNITGNQEDLSRFEKKLCAYENKNKMKRMDKDCETFISCLIAAKTKEKKLALTAIRQHVSEKQYLLKLIRKYAKGQSIYHRLSKQLKCVIKKEKKSIDGYNKIGEPCFNMPLIICSDDVNTVESEIFNCLGQNQGSSRIPSVMKQEIVQLKCLVTRCQEEKELLKQEMSSTLNWYQDQLVKLRRKLGELDTSGSFSLLIREGMYLEMLITHLSNLFQEYIGDTFTPLPLILTENVMSDDHKKMSEMLAYLASVEDLLVDGDSDSDIESDSEDESDRETESA